jgi:tetratricopeptide (TPR) repeat protein
MKSGEETRELEFNGGPITIGRSAENTLTLPDKKASRKHAQIEKVGETYLLTDLESGNGTKVNGQDVTQARVLVKGDEIKIGFSSLYVLNLDTPAPVAAPALPVAVAVAAPPPQAAAPAPAPAPAPQAAAPAPERKSPHTRRGLAHRSSSGGGGKMVAVAALLIIGGAIGFVGWQYVSKMPAKAPVASSKPIEKRVGPSLQQASEAYTAFQAKAATAEVNEALVAEAQALFHQYGEVYPEFEKLVTELNQKRLTAQVSKMSFEQVNGLVTAAMSEKRYGDAIDALKVLKGSKDASQAAALLEKIREQVSAEFKSVDGFGKKLAEQKQYTAAADHYRKEATRFRGTEHYRYLANKPENLEMLAEAELAAARAKEQKPVEIAKAPTPEPPKPAMEPPKPAMEPPKQPAMEPPKPKMDAPKPAMMEPPKPKPEPPKPPPPPPPPPPTPKPEPPKPAADAPKEDGPKPTVKKPAVLCDCKKIIKGNYCVKCDRELGPDDLRKNLCKRCEEKPKKIDLCLKRYFQAECHPEKTDDKPVVCDGKIYDLPHDDRARIVYLCESCDESGDLQSDIKHKAECKNRISVTKICMKSGTGPHAPDKK